jgi:superfamily II DNA or RNA helicase
MAKIQIAANCVHARVLNPTEEIKAELLDLLSYQIPGAEHTQATGKGWNGRSSLFGWEKSNFPAGFTTLVYSHLRAKGCQVQLIRPPAPDPLGAPFPIVNEFGRTEEYSYQYEAIERLIKHRAMIARIATGGGKSNVANIAFAWIKRPTLFLTTRSVLMYQMKEAFEASIKFRQAAGEAGLSSVRCGVMGDGDWSPSRALNVAMVQTIMAKLKDPQAREQMQRILAHFEFVILEEAHESSGEGYYQILNACTNATYRLALTGTPFMREDEEANMRLMAVSGPIGIEVTEKELIDKGILARPSFKYVEAPMPKTLTRSSNWQKAYTHGIVENAARNTLVCADAMRAVAAGLSVMILVQRKDHGKILQAQLAAAGARSRYIFGESDQATRKQALNDLKSGKINVLIGSTILDVGVDVPAVGMVILAGGGKAEVALRQRIGRGLRRKPKHLPNVAFIVDFKDTVNKHLIGHYRQRRSIIEATPGFAENILPPHKDFDYSQFVTK